MASAVRSAACVSDNFTVWLNRMYYTVFLSPNSIRLSKTVLWFSLKAGSSHTGQGKQPLTWKPRKMPSLWWQYTLSFTVNGPNNHRFWKMMLVCVRVWHGRNATDGCETSNSFSLSPSGLSFSSGPLTLSINHCRIWLCHGHSWFKQKFLYNNLLTT